MHISHHSSNLKPVESISTSGVASNLHLICEYLGSRIESITFTMVPNSIFNMQRTSRTYELRPPHWVNKAYMIAEENYDANMCNVRLNDLFMFLH